MALGSILAPGILRGAAFGNAVAMPEIGIQVYTINRFMGN